MLTLGLDTSTAMTAVALYDTEKGVIGESRGALKGSHAESVLPHLQHLLTSTNRSLDEVELIAVGVGPGSFTGLRIAVTMAKTLSQAKNCPLIGVSTLEAMAFGVKGHLGPILAVMDARRERAFSGLFRGSGKDLVRVWDDEVRTVQDLKASIIEPTLVVGPFATAFSDVPEALVVPAEHFALSAVSVAALGAKDYAAGRVDDYRTLVPIYGAPTRADRMKEVADEA